MAAAMARAEIALMKLVRPYIPLDVRIRVISRQLQDDGNLYELLTASVNAQTVKEALDYLLFCKFGDEKYHLDHDPPLCLREIIDAEAGLYDPDANSPDHLVYRSADEHRLKTFVRGDGAQLSDAAKRRKKLKAEKPKAPNRWPPKGSRPLQWWRTK